MLFDSQFSLWALFLSSFVSSTLFPGVSEAVLAALQFKHAHPATTLLAVATLGNTLGGMTSWVMGWWVAKRFPGRGLDEQRHRRALERLRAWGSPVLLFSWLPLVGDPLCMAAGWLRIHPLKSLLFIAIGKAARYVLILGLI